MHGGNERGIFGLISRRQGAREKEIPMREKRSRSLLRLGLAAVLACGMTPAVALAEPEAQITETPPPSSFLRS